MVVSISSSIYAAGGSTTSNCPYCKSRNTFTRECTGKFDSTTFSSRHLTLKGFCTITEYWHSENFSCSSCGVGGESSHVAEKRHKDCGKGTEYICGF